MADLRMSSPKIPFWSRALLVALTLCFGSPYGEAKTAPVGQLPTVTVSSVPSPYVLPVLLLNEMEEWKDFGIQVSLKIHADGEDQLGRIAGNEWEVGVMDPYCAVKGGNDGEVAIVGIAGNLMNQIHLLSGRSQLPSSFSQAGEALKFNKMLLHVPSSEHYALSNLFRHHGVDLSGRIRPSKNKNAESLLREKGDWIALQSPLALLAIQKGFHSWVELRRTDFFLPACLVASSLYADTRKTLVIRWLEGYGRGIHIIQKQPAKAAARLKRFFRETLQMDLPEKLLEQELSEAFLFEDLKREAPFRRAGESLSPLEQFAKGMTDYQFHVKAIQERKGPDSYILVNLCNQLAALRTELEEQFRKTRSAIQKAGREGTRIKPLQDTLEETRAQMEEGRGCLSVIGILADLERSATQAGMAYHRLRKFRYIELTAGGLLAFYYVGFFLYRRKKKDRRKRPEGENE